MTFALSARSLARLDGVHPDLKRVVHRAILKSEVDFTVLEGVRTPERQRQLYAQGRTRPGPKVTWTLNSRHFINPVTGYGHAVDLCPFPVDWSDTTKFDRIAEAMFSAARDLNVPIRWGADWDRDGRPRERGESDSPHFELAGSKADESK